ncbi:hypothetical protein BDR06DRAFT_969118 [Suillus hirtellus]|nr:hypothetical protein BDR06DRAFT_969118 [Suillus hirtellus]
MNNWNPTILLTTRLNHDCKLITNRGKMKHISCHKQEFSTPEVVSYLMKWDDQYISHHFETIYWTSVMSLLKKMFPTLQHPRCNIELSSEGDPINVKDRGSGEEIEYAVFKVYDRAIHLCDQICDYVDCGDALKNLTYLEYFLNTYDIHSEAENNCSDKAKQRQEGDSLVNQMTYAGLDVGEHMDDFDESVEDVGEEDVDISEEDILNASDGIFFTQDVPSKPTEHINNDLLHQAEQWENSIQETDEHNIDMISGIDTGSVQDLNKLCTLTCQSKG